MIGSIFAFISEEYGMKLDIETGFGRADFVIKSKDNKEVLIVELKVETDAEVGIEKILQQGEDQMINKKYGIEYDKSKLTRMVIACKGKEMRMKVLEN